MISQLQEELKVALVYPTRSYSMEDLDSGEIDIVKLSDLEYLKGQLRDKRELLQRYKHLLEKVNKTSRKYNCISRRFLKLCDEIPKLRKKISALVIDVSDV